MQATENPTAEGDKDSAENLTQDGLMQRLMQGQQEEPKAEVTEQVEAEEEPEVEESTEEPEGEPEEFEAEEETEVEASEDDEAEEESEIDLLSLSAEEIQELAKKGKSRLLSRIGELTARTKAAEEALEEIKASKPQREIPLEENPFKELKSFDDIRTKYEELEQTLEWTDDLLDEHSDYALDDIIEVQGQDFTKRQLKQANKIARDGINKFLPAHAQHLKKLEQVTQAKEYWQSQAKKEVPEIQDEESELGQAYKALVESPSINKLNELVAKHAPELGVDIEYILAHAVRSKFGSSKPSVPKGAGKKLKVNPPASPVGAGAARQGKADKSKVDAAYARFQETGDPNDFVAYQVAKATNS